jgi:broad specificity phosphatase PhoE
MVTIIFESHGTTFDNEAHRSSGWSDVALSPLGERQSIEMGERYKDTHLDAVYCSALQRSYRSAEIAFQGRTVPIIKDKRLNECNYGTFDGKPSEVVDPEKRKHVTSPFPGGESYEQTSVRMKDFLDEVGRKHQGQTIMVIGHRATQYGLEHWIDGVPLTECITAPWKWQPGWTYQLK